MSSPLNVEPPFVWVVAAYDRDWRERGFLERFFDAVASLELIGSVDTVVVGDDRHPESPPAAASGLVTSLWSQSGPASLIAAGTAPRPWSAGISSFADADGIIARLTFRFSGDFSEAVRSDALWSTFRSVVGQENATCSYVDGWSRWLDLQDEAPPLVSGATLETILWANFADADTLRKFQREKPDLSPAAESEVTEDGGVYIRLTEVLAPAHETARADLERRRRELRENLLRTRND